LLCAVLRADEAETESGDLLEAYRDSIYPSQGRWRANLWYVLQVAGYVVRSNPSNWNRAMTSTLWVLALELVVGIPMIAFGGGLILLATLVGSCVSLVYALFCLSREPRRAGKVLAVWGIYLLLYIAVSTGLALLQHRNENPIVIGQEVCADAGCFGVDNVDRRTAGSETVYTLFWHLSSKDKKLTRSFPGKGLELYMFDEHGRKFALPATENPDPLNVTLSPGGTVRHSISFHVPADAHELFLTARYRPFTFQSLLPGELSLVSRPHVKRIRIQ
jgi:hypothetical protein